MCVSAIRALNLCNNIIDLFSSYIMFFSFRKCIIYYRKFTSDKFSSNLRYAYNINWNG